jgi:hypothetical protein
MPDYLLYSLHFDVFFFTERSDSSLSQTHHTHADSMQRSDLLAT